MRARVVLLMCLLFGDILSAGHALSAQTRKISDIKVFVTTHTADSHGFVDNDQKQRLDSVSDIRKHLAKSVQLVDSEKTADVVLEVVGRERAGINSATTITAPDHRVSETSQDTAPTVYLQLKANGYSANFSGSGGSSQIFGAWGYAAKIVSRAALKWIDHNHDQLVAIRAEH